MHFVDQTQGKVLANHGSSTADPDVFSVCRLPRSRQSRLRAIGNKMEYRVPVHRKVGPWVMREHKDRRMVWGIVAPPAFPGIVLPWTANRPKHIAAHNPCANIFERLRSKIVVDAYRSTAFSNHLLEGFGWE